MRCQTNYLERKLSTSQYLSSRKMEGTRILSAGVAEDAKMANRIFYCGWRGVVLNYDVIQWDQKAL
jgi:hypothetical protein